MKKILFICTGNTCRSPMAVGLLKKVLADKRRQGVKVTSAGVMAVSGMPASHNAYIAMQEIGIDISEHRSELLTKEIIDGSDIIFVMTQIHKLEVINMLDKPGKEIYLIRSFDPDILNSENEESAVENLDIPDPIGKPIELYRFCRDEIKRCMPKIIEKILEK